MRIQSAFLFVLIALVLAGCQSGVDTRIVERDFHTGTQGVEMRFLPGAPPPRVFDGEEVDVIVELRNQGAYPLTENFEGHVSLSGFDPISLIGQWEARSGSGLGSQFADIRSSLVGRSQFNPEGGIDTLNYLARARVPFAGSQGNDLYRAPIIAHTCYRYKTIASPDACIDPSPFSAVQENKACRVGEYGYSLSVGGGQGGPVAVSSVIEEVGAEKIFFRISITNGGGGSVIDYGDVLNDCPFNLNTNQIDRVEAGVQLAGSSIPDCTPRGDAGDPIRLYGGRGTMFCSFQKPDTDSAYLAPLQIELRYGYSTSIRKDIEIINLQ